MYNRLNNAAKMEAALFEAKLNLEFAATVDVDAINNAQYTVIVKSSFEK